jgi:hypothetical protein
MARYGDISGSRKTGSGIKFEIDAQGMTREIERAMRGLTEVKIVKGMQIGLRNFAELVAQDVRENAPAKHLRENVSVKSVEVEGIGKYKVNIIVDTPDARAWEFGSGEHATKGTPKRYLIKPKEGNKSLSFYWKTKGKWVVLPKVHHPGIAAKPYLAPAMRRNLRRINVLIAEGIRSVKY